MTTNMTPIEKPIYKSIFILNDFIKISCKNKMPSLFHRFVQKIFFGFEWKEWTEDNFNE